MIPSKSRINKVLAAALFCAALVSRVTAGEASDDVVARILARFTPEKPTMELSYNIAYRFLCLHLKTLGTGSIDGTEGSWLRPSGERVHAVMLTIAMDSLDDRESADRGRVSLHDRVTIVMTMPQLETLMYLKDTDRYLNPLFRKKSVARYQQLYNLEGTNITYYHKDLLTGEVSTKLEGETDLRKQAQEVPMLLRLMSDVYYGRHAQVRSDPDVRLYVNIRGVVTPFSVVTDYETVDESRCVGKIKALRARTGTAPEAKVKVRGVVMWSASLRDTAARTDDLDLQRLSKEVPDWNMIPLLADYNLALGSTRFTLERMRVLHKERWDSAVLALPSAKPPSGAGG
jgi:hypothetical protein